MTDPGRAALQGWAIAYVEHREAKQDMESASQQMSSDLQDAAKYVKDGGGQIAVELVSGRTLIIYEHSAQLYVRSVTPPI